MNLENWAPARSAMASQAGTEKPEVTVSALVTTGGFGTAMHLAYLSDGKMTLTPLC